MCKKREESYKVIPKRALRDKVYVIPGVSLKTPRGGVNKHGGKTLAYANEFPRKIPACDKHYWERY